MHDQNQNKQEKTICKIEERCSGFKQADWSNLLKFENQSDN